MNIKLFLFISLLLFILLFRIQQQGGVYEEGGNFELESISYKFEDVRGYIGSMAEYFLPQPQAGLLAGMVLGIKSTLPPDFTDALKNTSTLHIVVVSGQNLTLLAGFLMSLVSVLGRRKAILLSLGAILFYAVISGLQLPVLRAAIMVFFASLAQLTNREGDSIWILILTALIMLIYDPNWILSISFQLSFLATVGVVVVAPEVIKRLNMLPEIIKQDFAISLSAQLMVLPIIAANFNQISITGILANTLILWTVPLIMISGSIVLLAGLLNIFLGQILSIFPNILLTYFVYIVTFFSGLAGSIYVGNLSYLVWFGYYVILLGVFLALRKSNSDK